MAGGGRNSGERKTISAGRFVVQGNFYNLEPSAPPPDPHALDKARELFAALPVDIVPEPAPLPSCSYMPLRTNNLFVGRDAELRGLARIVAAGGTAAIGQIAAATGLGGIGKTQLAVEFAYRYGKFFAGGVFWLSFAEPTTIPAEVARCGDARGLALQANSTP